MKIYAAYVNADLTEGRGPMRLDELFMHKEHAEAYINKQPGIMGRRREWTKDPDDWELRVLNVNEHCIIKAAAESAELAKSALKKLSLAERRALGLEE